ncbi:hypothetical protein GGR55DRAFT_517455 [Xylaria sp. FL0064]|nr:hypothetical protein GGR55DRAFT_517455 [Xylaria sp. FL0064]
MSSIATQFSTSVGYGTQISLGSPTQITTTPPLTTVFTPPPECKTPFAFIYNCDNDFECDGSYLPVLYNPVSGEPGSSPIQCLPQTTVIDDSFVDGVYDYNPGLFCPDGMTTETSIGTTFLCCPSGLTYSFDGYNEQCTGTMTKGTVLGGDYAGIGGIVGTTIIWSVADNMTLYVAATPVYLYQGSDAITSDTFGNLPTPTSTDKAASDASKTSVSTVTVSASDTTAIHGCFGKRDCQTATSPTNKPSSGPSKAVKIGASVGGAIAFIILALASFLLLRYRRRRLLRTRHLAMDSPPTQPETEVIQHIYVKKNLPELPVVESRVELEGTPGQDRGPGIYVWKPELEGTAGIHGVEGVYVRKKSELEARYDGGFTVSPVMGSMSATTAGSESPVVGPSVTRHSMPR